MLPVDVVADLMVYGSREVCGRSGPISFVFMLREGVIRGESREDLRSNAREYLLSLVPKPVNLSECEEGVSYCGRMQCYRLGEFAYSNIELVIGRASEIEVIQPAEVT